VSFALKLENMIKKIGVENFRVFKSFTEFEIKPLTLLVGPNNAGKSSFTKLLLLLKNDTFNLNFNEGLHNLESFAKVLNWETDNKFVKIRYDNQLDFLNDSFNVDVIYSNGIGSDGIMLGINILNGEENLLSFTPVGGSGLLNFNIDLMISLIYNDTTTSFLNIDDNREFYGWIDNNEFEHKFYEGDLTLENFEKVIKNNSGYSFHNIGKIVLKHEIKKLERDYLLYDVFVKGKKATEYYKKEIIEFQKLEFSKIEGRTSTIDLINSLENCLQHANETVKYKIKCNFTELLNENNIEIKETRLGRLLFIEKLFATSIMMEALPPDKLENVPLNYQKTFFQQFNNFLQGLDVDFNTIEYISANRGSQKRILYNKSENDIDKIVLDFFNKSDKNKIYVEKIFAVLEIPGELIVERSQNVISVVYLLINDKKTALADVGFGYSQLIPIILKLATMTASIDQADGVFNPGEHHNNMYNFREYKENKILIIEEPEANLHPNLQSKLADMLVTTIETYPYINFIIETHSEYLIRKLQFLTASKKVGTDKSIIYYFNADKYVTADEPKVKPIEIKENGSLSHTFGPGFYDEISRLQFDLMKLNQEQSN
jgi:predicted ATPase